MFECMARAAGGSAAYQVPGAAWTDGAADSWSITPASAGNRRVTSRRIRCKRLSFGTKQVLFSAGTASIDELYFDTDNKLKLAVLGTVVLVSSRVFRDVGHYVDIGFDLDTTQAVAADRAKLIFEDAELSYSTDSRSSITQNADTSWNNTVVQYIGRQNGGSYLKAIVSEPMGVDGGVPTAYSGVDTAGVAWPVLPAATYGTNGFYLPLSNSVALGTNDAGTDWALNSITSANATQDVPSAPRNTINILRPDGDGANSSEGAMTLDWVTNDRGVIVNVPIHAGEKRYFEVVVLDLNPGAGHELRFGVAPDTIDLSASRGGTDVVGGGFYGYGNAGTAAAKYLDGSSSSYGSIYVLNDVIGIVVDRSTDTLTAYKNGTTMGDITTSLPSTGDLFPMAGGGGGAPPLLKITFRFQSDDWTETLPSGITSVNAVDLANFPEPAIKNVDEGFVQVIDTEANIEATLATAISNAGWGSAATIRTYKNRTAVERWMLVYSDDAANELDCQATLVAKAAKRALAGTNNWVGYAERVGAAYGLYTAEIAHTNGADTTTAHGLSSDTSRFEADMRSTGAGGDWWESHPDLTANYNIKRNSSAAETATQYISVDATNVVIKSAAPTATYRVIVRAEIPGYRVFGKYIGNGSAAGALASIGVSVDCFGIKITNTTGAKPIFLSKINTYNVANKYFYGNLDSAEATVSGRELDLLSSGVKLRGTIANINASGSTYVFEAYGSPTGGKNTTPAPAQ